MMESVCRDSPMYDFVEQAAGKEVRAPLGTLQHTPVAVTSLPKDAKDNAELLAQFAAQFQDDFGEIEFDDLNENIGTARDLMRM